MVKDIAVAEVRYSSVKFSLRLGDISVQSETTTLDVFTSHLKEFLIPRCRCFPPFLLSSIISEQLVVVRRW